MRTSSKDFRTSLFAAALAVITLFPAVHAQGSTVPSAPTARAEAKVSSVLGSGSAHYEPGTYMMTILSTRVLKAPGSSPSTPAATNQEIAYGYNDCVRDCVGPWERDKEFERFCMFACN